MSSGFINDVDFVNIEAERYWSFPKVYKGNKIEEMLSMVRGNEYYGSEKKDGMYSRFVKDEDGECFLISRNENVNGEMTNKLGHVPQLKDFFNSLPNGTCFLGEIYFPNNPGSRRVTTIMGCLEEKAISRQEKGEKLHYYIFDIWAYKGKSLLKTNIDYRIEYLKAIKAEYNSPYVEYAQYFCGSELEDELARVREAAGEGIVITKKGTIPAPGKRTARKTLKIKTELDSPIDCFLTGNWKPATRLYKGDHIEEWRLWENVRTGEKLNGFFYQDYEAGAPVEPISKAHYYGWASAVELGLLDENGKVVSVGWISGISEEIKEGIVHEPDKWIHKVAMVNAMGIEPDSHKFRHGRIVTWRTDKTWRDCELSQLF